MKIKKFAKIITLGIILVLGNLIATIGYANGLENLRFELLSDGKVKVIMDFSECSVYPRGFSLETPPQLIFDFANVKNDLPDIQRKQIAESHILKGLQVFSTGGRVRVVINMVKILPYKIKRSGKRLEITIADVFFAEPVNVVSPRKSGKPCNAEYIQQNNNMQIREIQDFDFKRGSEGEGIVVVKLPSAGVGIDLDDSEEGIVRIRFKPATLPERLARRYDVTDFGTLVDQATLRQNGNEVVLELKTKGRYEKIAYQLDTEYIVEIRPEFGAKCVGGTIEESQFTGERISLNFQNIDVRAVLQLLADFTGLNLVASDSISGNITLRLSDVPWDQALDMILKAKGLAKREDGNILLIGPREEIASREKLELESKTSLEYLIPIRTELIQFKFASAKDFASKLSDKDSSFLSKRGRVSVDERTNTLLIQDIGPKIVEIQDLIAKLDLPVRQVQIEAQIVDTTTDVSDALGVRLAGGARVRIGDRVLGVAGDVVGTGETTVSTAQGGVGAYAAGIASGAVQVARGWFFDGGPAKGSVGALGLSLFRLPGGTLLDLELSAVETETLSKVLSRPKLTTLDKQKASISQGQQIPYQSSSANTGTNTQFVEANTKLEVTPSIAPDDKIELKISITKDTVGAIIPGTEGSQPPIDTQALDTTVLVDNGETIVIGGLFEQTKTVGITGLPFFCKIPFIGRLFRNYTTDDNRSELLFFITPRIIDTRENA